MAYELIAAVDLGSNSFRLQVGRIVSNQIYPLDGLKEPVRLAAGLKAPHVTGASADVSLTVSSYRPVPFGAFVQTITMRVFEPATGKVLWFSRGGYGVREALSDAESTELFGAAPSYRDFCTMRYDWQS